eukprot:s1794_g22.t1
MQSWQKVSVEGLNKGSCQKVAGSLDGPEVEPQDEGHVTTDSSDSSNEGGDAWAPVVGHYSLELPLHFEASAIIMAELKTRATDTSGDGVRKLPIAEKAARLKDQETRLPGLRIKGELQPSYALVDMAHYGTASDDTRHPSGDQPSASPQQETHLRRCKRYKESTDTSPYDAVIRT